MAERSTTDQAKQQAGQVADQTKGKASEVAAQAKGQVSSQLDSQRIRAAEGLDSVASAVRQMSGTLREQDQGTAAHFTDDAAQRIDRVAQYLQTQDTQDMIAEVERFARRQPALFLGGAFALGVVGARFLKASQPDGGSQGSGYDRALPRAAGEPYTPPRYADTPRRSTGYGDTPPGMEG